jgi:hypothetical protein
MKFFIEVEGDTAKELVDAIDRVRERLVEGGCHLNVGFGNHGNALLKPQDIATEDEFRRQYRRTHPEPAYAWPK